MANRPCSSRIICPGQDNPLGNYSYEQPDPFSFLSFRYPITNPINPIGGPGPNNPPVYFAADCAGLCVSFLSQEDADLCAARQAFICAHTPPGGTPPQTFRNGLQTCALACGSGSVFIWQTLPGSFVALSQAAADEQAFAYACEQAALRAFCLNDIPNTAQTGVSYGATIFVESGNPLQPVSFSVVSGSLPPGLTLMPEGPLSTFLTGMPTLAGTFTFTILCRDSLNIFVTKTYTITVTSVCSAFWSTLVPGWAFTTLGANSVANLVGNVITISAYVRQALDASALAQAQVVAPSTTLNQFQCTLTVTPIAKVNAINMPALQLLVQDINTAVIYFSSGVIVPVSQVVFNFTLPVGAKPLVSFQDSVVNAGNAMDSQLAYSITLG